MVSNILSSSILALTTRDVLLLLFSLFLQNSFFNIAGTRIIYTNIIIGIVNRKFITFYALVVITLTYEFIIFILLLYWWLLLSLVLILLHILIICLLSILMIWFKSILKNRVSNVPLVVLLIVRAAHL